MTSQEMTLHTDNAMAEAAVGDIMLNPALLDGIANMAKALSNAVVTVPEHLRGKEADCYAVVLQAVQWRMNPFVVAQKTHVVKGTLGYEAQLVNAVVQNSGALDSPFRYEYEGQGQSLKCRVGATLRGDRETTWGHWLAINEVKVKNSPLWDTNPKQQLGYLQLKNFVRQYCPGPILGVYTIDELQDMPVQTEREVAPAPDTTAAPRSEALADQLLDEAEEAEIVEPEPKPEEANTLTYASVAEGFNTAESPEQLQAALDDLATFVGIDGNERYRDELGQLYRDRLAQLKAIADEIKQ